MMEDLSPKKSDLVVEKKYFLIFFFLLLANLSALSILIVLFPPIRYFRQPSLVLALFSVIHYFPVQKIKKGFTFPLWLFWFFVGYFTFNTLTSIDPTNTATYGGWMLGILSFSIIFWSKEMA